MAPEASDTQPVLSGKGGRKLMPVILIGAVMALEGVGVFFLAKVISPGPASVEAAESKGGEKGAVDGNVDHYAELELAECRPSNMMSGRFVTFQIRVSGLVDQKDLERAGKMVSAKRARIEDGVNTVFRSAEPKHLSEPELVTMKRRLKHEFDQIFGDDQLIKQVLIPQMLQSRPGV